MNISAAAASPISGASNSSMSDGIQTLCTGLELARASQLTMLRFQLALHKSDRRGAMQALDSLLDIDAEMEGLASTVRAVPTQLTGDAVLSGFIGLQKAAIAAEKHALTGGVLRYDAQSIVASAPDDGTNGANIAAQPLLSDNDIESDDRTSGRRWMPGLAVAIAVVAIVALGYGLITHLWPEVSVTMMRF